MGTLSIELQDGFADDTVVVSVDGREAARREGVRTNLAISRADAIPLEVPDGPVTLGISVPSQRLGTQLEVEGDGVLYVKVNARGGRLEAVPSRELPLYM